MIVGVAHLAAKNDMHNNNFDDPLGPERQKQIADFIRRLAVYHPTKVMIEQRFGTAAIQERYERYLKGSYALGPNEVEQFGFRLAALSKNSKVYPIDTEPDDFPFDYDPVKQSAERNHQSAILDEADEKFKPYEARQRELIEKGTMLELVRFLNTPEALETNAGWYMYADRIGAGKDYSGADLVAIWYARNLHIFANVMRSSDSPDDRMVVFIGSGHVKSLSDFVKLSPDLELVDPVPYLDGRLESN